MDVKTCQSQYSLAEFHSYLNKTTEDDYTSVVELLIDADQLDFIEKDFSGIFIVETNKHTYVFSNYEVIE